MKATLDFLNIACQTVPSIKELLNSKQKANLCILSGLKECTDEEAKLLREYQAKGGRLLLLNSKEAAQKSILNTSPDGSFPRKETLW